MQLWTVMAAASNDLKSQPVPITLPLIMQYIKNDAIACSLF